jgi:hypothetical protein
MGIVVGMRYFASLLLLVSVLLARPFTVAVYNVENLFDVDGKAGYKEYQPSEYTPAHLGTKVRNIAEVVSRMVDGGRGPDVIFFQEIELDQTPSAVDLTAEQRLAPFAGRTLAQMLSSPVSPEAADLPAEAWLLKAFQERGLTGYTVVAGNDSVASPHEDGNTRSIKNVVFTRLPVKSVRNHPIPYARNILELLVEVDGHPLYLFSNHWKSGAGDAALERIRVSDAAVLRARLDQLLSADPHADIIIGGDFNSQYNQKRRYPAMRETGLNDVLRSQGDELALRGQGADLYNLWYELPAAERGSDTYRGEWGTLMQLLVSRGLYDFRGVQYVDGSFKTVRLAGLNMNDDGTPRRWSFNGPAGSGTSDHLPIIAQFRTVEDNAPERWLELKNPSDGTTPSENPRVGADLAGISSRALRPDALPKGTNLRDGSFNGKMILVEGRATVDAKLGVDFRDENWDIYCPDSKLRDRLRSVWRTGDAMRFYGELGQYRGRWQFVIKDPSWILLPSP